eukprot:scaffold4958_cov406-Prasinococcus_capsulatus_cf.AAC.19
MPLHAIPRLKQSRRIRTGASGAKELSTAARLLPCCVGGAILPLRMPEGWRAAVLRGQKSASGVSRCAERLRLTPVVASSRP